MDQKQVFKQMIDFNKKAFDTSFSAMTALQDQTEKIGNTLMEKTPWIPEEGKKAAGEWAAACKKGRDQFKKSMDNTFQKMEEFF